ncbi:MAG: right-handed parallel beta-helix repeat-containing protein [Armatimonadota bacterium]
MKTMQWLQISMIVALMVVFTCVSTQGAEYFVSPDGDDAAAGTEDAPWKTLGKVNEILQPGDTALFLPGKYPGSITPAQSGTADAPIIFRSTEPLAATLTGGNGFAIALNDHSHIRVEGFSINVGGSSGWVNAVGCDHVTIRGCVMHDARSTAQFVKSEQMKLLDNVFSKDRVTGNMWHILQCSHVLIEGNSFERVGHSPMQITTSQYVVVRANSFQNPWGRNYEFWTSGRLLIERNIITNARDSGYSADSRAKNVYIESIFRHNRAFGNLHTCLNSPSYVSMGGSPTHPKRRPYRLLDSRLYNNTIAGNLGHAWEFAGMCISSNIVMNNVFANNDWAGGNLQLRYGDSCSRDNRFRNNLIHGTEEGQKTVEYRGELLSCDEVNKKTSLLRNYWSEFQDNIDADPDLVDIKTGDFHTGPESACIDAGTPLALAIDAGEGRELTVSDGIPFYDGFGIEGEEGDWIAIGSPENLARIERIELRYDLSAILHLDREVSWTDGMPVSLPWAGDAPDIGVYERDLTHPQHFRAFADPVYPRPGEPVTFSLDTLGKTVKSVRWNFRDGTYSNELSPRHTWEELGNHGVVVRAEFENGESSVEIVYVGVEEPLAPGDPLIKADMEDATRETEWGFHFKFYRSWLTGYEHVEREIGEGKCMHLFMDPKKRNRAAGALAPGVWEIDSYPIIRFEYRIPEGVPVGIVVEPYRAADLPSGWMLGGTEAAEPGKYIEVSRPELVDDNQWHEAEVDLRAVREATPDVTHLYRFMFYCNWQTDEGQEFRFDNFYVLPQ